MVSLIWLTIALPLLGVLVNGLLGKRLGRAANGIIGSGTVLLAFLLGLLIFFRVPGLDHHSQTVHLWDFITIGAFNVPASLLVDPLSMIMVLVVTGVGSLIHIYAIGYMDHDKDVARFFTYLNLFIASMLVLVLSDNYLGMFVGWELVGMCSYLLIGFWYVRPAAADAGKKAFIVNRVGDFGFMLGVFLIWHTFGSLQFAAVFEGAATAVPAVISTITLLLFVGAIGKSAQIPLYVWLPDAMEGPTPVSALIHAATMVTAGVYMIARSNVLYALAPGTSLVVAFIGGITAFFAATIALTQFDLKRVLAYSTISQLGYMVMAVGVGAYASGIFHLVTHAFFKALLFMAAGSVMHAMGDVIDMRRLGGLKAKMPATYMTFLIGAAALAGFPLTAGFFSKDEILALTWQENKLLYIIGIVTAFMTAFYTFRAVYMTFFGEPKDQPLYDHAHENRAVMIVPLWILAALAAIGGLLGLPAGLGKAMGLNWNWMEHWLEPVFEETARLAHHPSLGVEVFLLIFSAAVAVAGIWLAYYVYRQQPEIAVNMAKRYQDAYKILYNKYYVDELYDQVIVGPLRRLSQVFSNVVDKGLIDTVLVDGTARVTGGIGRILAGWQTGYTRNYVTTIFIASIIISLYFFLR